MGGRALRDVMDIRPCLMPRRPADNRIGLDGSAATSQNLHMHNNIETSLIASLTEELRETARSPLLNSVVARAYGYGVRSMDHGCMPLAGTARTAHPPVQAAPSSQAVTPPSPPSPQSLASAGQRNCCSASGHPSRPTRAKQLPKNDKDKQAIFLIFVPSSQNAPIQ